MLKNGVTGLVSLGIAKICDNFVFKLSNTLCKTMNKLFDNYTLAVKFEANIKITNI